MVVTTCGRDPLCSRPAPPQALIAIEADEYESEEEAEELEAAPAAPRLPPELPSANCRSLLELAPARTWQAMPSDDAAPVPKAPFSSPAKSSAPFTAFARLREARLARQRLMSPMPVCRRRKPAVAPPRGEEAPQSGRSGAGENDLAACQATMLMGLWRLGGEEDASPSPQ